MKSQIRRLAHDIERFWRNQSGVVAILFGVLVVPMLGFLGMVIDYGQALVVKTEIQAALDATALATAAATNLTESERITLGQKTFEANWSTKAFASMPAPSISIDLDTSTGEDTITVSASSSVEMAFLGVISIDQINVGATSTAVTIKAAPICILALNKTVERAINIQGGATLVSVGCAVHANSSHDDALYASGSSSAMAEQFCAVGGYEGNNFTPKPKSCGYVEDPYKDMVAPNTSGCDHNNTKIKKQDDDDDDDDGLKTLSPGVYCGGINVQTQANVTFNPGLYVIKDGALIFSSGSTVTGNGVTFYFTGINTRLTVISSATVNLTAPSGGTYEGFIFIQDPLSNPSQFTGKQNEIQGGGSIKIVGTIYFPTQPMTISGNGIFGINSPMMPIIVDTLTVTGNGVKTIQVDQTAANMFQDLPKAIDGARLIN